MRLSCPSKATPSFGSGATSLSPWSPLASCITAITTRTRTKRSKKSGETTKFRTTKTSALPRALPTWFRLRATRCTLTCLKRLTQRAMSWPRYSLITLRSALTQMALSRLRKSSALTPEAGFLTSSKARWPKNLQIACS